MANPNPQPDDQTLAHTESVSNPPAPASTNRQLETMAFQNLVPEVTAHHIEAADTKSFHEAAYPTQVAADGIAGLNRKVPGYTLLSKLGQGGMGVVYKARDEKLNRVVALKMILAGVEDDSRILQRFQTEAEAVAKLQHPNIVQIFAIGETNGLPFFSLEYVDGQPLSSKIGKEPQDEKASAIMVETLARAMHAAHESKIIHRDLKPANVLLSSTGVPKIADFGLAKELEADTGQTNSGAILGTPSYMSPEQATGADNIGPATDIYALGAILYDMLTGRPPFLSNSKWTTLEMVRKMEPISPASLTGKLSRDLDTICLKCLQKEPSKRYASALELAEDLRRYIEGRPILARPVSGAEKAWRWAKRNPVIASLAALSQLLLVASIVLAITSYIQKTRADENALIANNARIEEERQRLEAVKAKKEEENQRIFATERFNSQLGTIRKLITEIQDALRSHPNGRALREKVTKLALGELENAKKQAIASTLIDRTEAGGMARLGDIYLEQNRPEDALELYNKANDILGKLRDNEPEQPVHVRNLAAILNKIGDTSIRLGDTRKAYTLFQKSLELRQAWGKMPSNLIPGTSPAAAPQSVAESHVLLGRGALLIGEPTKAMEHFQNAKADYDALGKDFRESPANQRDLAELKEFTAKTLFKTGKTQEATQAFEEIAKDRVQRMKDRNILTTRRDLALSLVGLGDHVIQSGGDPMVAFLSYQRALPVMMEPLKIDALNYTSRKDVSLLHFKMGIAVERFTILAAITGKAICTGVTERHFAESLKVREELAKDGQLDTNSQFDYAIALARCGKVTEAEKIVDAFIKNSPTDPMVLAFSANTLSMCVASSSGATAERLTLKAVKTLETLLQNGWKDFVYLKTIPTLDPIRNHPKFPKLP